MVMCTKFSNKEREAEMKLKRYLVFGFKTIARIKGQSLDDKDPGGWNDLIESYDEPEFAIRRANDFLDLNHMRSENAVAQVVDLRTGQMANIKNDPSSRATREYDIKRAEELFKSSDMDRQDIWELH